MYCYHKEFSFFEVIVQMTKLLGKLAYELLFSRTNARVEAKHAMSLSAKSVIRQKWLICEAKSVC